MRKTDDAWRPFSTLSGFVRLVLLIDWDPIGILGYSGAMDEYDSYVNDICRLIQEGATRDMLVAHLDRIEKQQMGGLGERPVQTEVAEKLLEIYKAIQQNERWRTQEE
ncbi:MAG: hypothetical protein JWL77_3829 [Chthonomonadaceae bacterium]|nr:hypothetical protein [Chthonomonadaceae bacterium]